MNRTVQSVFAFLLAGVMIVGVTACSKKEKSPEVPIQSVDAYDTPETYIRLPNLSSVEISTNEIEEEIASQIYEICSSKSQENYEETAEAAKAGDRLNLSMTGRAADESVTLSDTALNGLNAEKIDYVIGTNTFVDAYYDEEDNMLTDSFDNQLVGFKAGETKEIRITFPDDYPYSEEVRGVEIIMSVTVHSVSRLTVGEMDKLTVSYTTAQPEGDTNKLTDFRALFSNGTIVYDPLSESSAEKKFCMLFNFADYADCFVGANKFDVIEVKVTVPEDAGEKYADYLGKEITVSFTVASVSSIPEWDDEFVKKYSEEQYTSAAEYEEVMRASLVAEKAFSIILEKATVNSYPTKETHELYEQYAYDLFEQMTGKSVEGLAEGDLRKLLGDETYEKACSSVLLEARQDVKKRLVQEMLFKTLNVTVTEDEYKQELEAAYEKFMPGADSYEQQYGVRIDSAEELETYYGKENIEGQLKMNKVMDLLPEKITMVD